MIEVTSKYTGEFKPPGFRVLKTLDGKFALHERNSDNTTGDFIRFIEPPPADGWIVERL